MTRLCRPAQHQGVFYPVEPLVLQQQLNYLLTTDTSPPKERVKALIAPHAAYDYSGRVAGQAYAALRNQSPYKRVVILAPNHQNTKNCSLICNHKSWATPLGKLAIDQAFIHKHWINQPNVLIDNATHQAEYSIEVHLPFLRHLLPDTPVVPVLTGRDEPTHTLKLLQPAWEDAETLIIISADLYHHLPRENALSAGRHIAHLIENNDHERLRPEQSCGHISLRGIMSLAAQGDYYWRTLALQHSGQDNRFSSSTYVGYGAFLLMNKNSKLPLS